MGIHAGLGDQELPPAQASEIDLRASLRPVFVYGIPEAEWREAEWEAAAPDVSPDIDRRGRRMLEDVPESEELDASPALTGMGVGADGYAIALVVGAGIVYVASAANDLLDVAARLRRFWLGLRARHGPPILSLGAVVHLVVLDLSERLGSLEGVRIVSATDVSPTHDGGGHTGQAVYSVILARDEDVWVYLVGDKGQVVHFGQGRQRRSGQLSLLSGELISGEGPTEPEGMLFTMRDGELRNGPST